MSDDNSAARLPASHSRTAIAARYAAAVLGAAVGSAVLRYLLHRFLAMPRDSQLLGPIILALILGLFWFVLTFLVLLRSDSGDDGSSHLPKPALGKTKSTLRTITLAIVTACILAISACAGLYLNDELFESRLLPWIAPPITFQGYGFRKASQLLPCQIDAGCEAYKWLPTFLIGNSLLYLPFALVVLFSFQHLEAVRKIMQTVARLFARWCIVVVGAGLIALQIMHGLNLDTHDSLHPNPGIEHRHFGAWEQINDITGTLVTIAGLSLPFYLYRAIRRADSSAEVQTRLAAATSVTAAMLVALMLANVY